MLKYKTLRKLIIVQCDYCGIDYEKPITEYNRNQQKNRHSFCSRSCSIKHGNSHREKDPSKYKHLLEYSGNNKGKTNPFKYYLRTIRKRFKDINVTLEYLEEIWKQQKGKCPYSGIDLILASSITKGISPIYRASLDRIDSSKGYVEGNIQFVSTSINYMKNTMSHIETINLCKLIAKNYICTLMQEWTISSSSINEETDALAGN